jgi:hypothetical protein
MANPRQGVILIMLSWRGGCASSMGLSGLVLALPSERPRCQQSPPNLSSMASWCCFCVTAHCPQWAAAGLRKVDDDGQGTHGFSRGLGRWITPCDPSDGPALTRLSSGGSGQTMEATTVTAGSRPTSRTLPQCGPLESLAADTLGVVYETGQGAMPPLNLAEGREPGTSARLRHARRPRGQGVPARKGQGVVGCRRTRAARRGPCLRHPIPPTASAVGFPGDFL